MRTVKDAWSSRVAESPEDLFLVVMDGDPSEFTYREFNTLTARTANGLAGMGVRAGTRVAYHVPNGLDMLRLELALQLLGAVSVPLITGSTSAEIAHVLKVSEPYMFVADTPGSRGLEAIADRSVVPRHVVLVGGGLPELDSGNRTVPDTHIDPLAPMSIRFTSGSTARPKGVVQPSAGFATSGEAIARRLALAPSDRVLCAIPLFHTAGTNMLLAPVVVAGATLVLIPKFSRTRFWNEVRATGASVTMLMATQISMLMTDPVQPDDRDNPLRIVITHNRADSFNSRFDVDTITMWAMTETSGIGTLSTPGQSDYTRNLVGTSTSSEAELRIVDLDGKDVDPGMAGELLFRHPHAMLEYYNDPVSTSATMDNGWIRTGDLCQLDARGQLSFCGRLKNLIKRGGENISGEEVESVIATHPAVEEVVVCGVPDPVYSEEVHATVALRDGHSLTEAELVSYCAQHIVDWKIPRFVLLAASSLPKLGNGKTDRATITVVAREQLATTWDRRATEPRV